MKTSSWMTVGATPGRVGISLGTPRGQPAGFRLYRALAPTRDMLHLDDLSAYEPRYQAILDALDAQKVWDDLHALAGKDASGAQVEPIMLCFEKPPFTRVNFCHRRLAARWLEQKLGVEIPERGFEGRDVDYPGFRQAALAI